ncbi:F-box protein SKIP2-like [Ceratina calcarata]|uniref:F-box protein SKIP2-like n=1 Tax=Ceratina calcarata TaxID=156304 RepID=A0AAJ7RY76_9HYME|nr:F-box protein SKIP2-like [Ceratina calcarata]
MNGNSNGEHRIEEIINRKSITMTDYIQCLSNNLQHSHILEDNDALCCDFLPVTEDGVPIRKLFISNLAERTTYKDLEKLFSKYGNVESCFLRRNQGKSNYAFVTFNSAEAVVRAVYEEDTIRLHNRNLKVVPADSWHQPDNIENRYHNTKDKKACNEQYNEEYLQNDMHTSIQILNNDCLIHIFLQLPIVDRIRIERVCKRWRILSKESWHSVKKLDLSSSMWGTLPGSKHREINTSTLRKVLLRCGPYLNEINLSQMSSPLNPSTLTIVGKLCPNLQRIDVTGLTVSTSGINSLTDNCRDIVKFSLGSTTHICDLDLQRLFKVNQKLRYFKLAFGKISGRCLFYVPLETMEEVVLESCSSLQERSLSKAIEKLQNLKSLTISKCFDISGNVIQAISANCTTLKTLELSSISFLLQSSDMLHIAELVNLEVLKINANAVVTDELLINLASKCLKLKYVDITECILVTNVGVAAISSLPKLEVLIMNYLQLVTDTNLRDACNLKRLECRICKFTDKVMTNLIGSAPQLELLDLSGCCGITNETLKKAAIVTVNRTNNTILKIFVGGTSVELSTFDKISPFLQIVNVDLSNRNNS